MISLEKYVNNGNILIAAHRGASGLAPENTLSAFELAYEQGANMLETDLQFTSDGYAVAFHDLKHLDSSKSLINKNLTLKDIKKIDAGSWFNSKFANETIPTFEEILEFAKNKLYINFEIKHFNGEFNEAYIKRLIDVVKDFDMAKYVMFASFDYRIIKFIKSVDDKIHTAAIKIPGNYTLPSEIAKSTGCEAFICDFRELSEEINQDCLENNLFVGTYSIDNEEDFKKIIKYNIRAIGTNFPAKIKDLILKYNYHLR